MPVTIGFEKERQEIGIVTEVLLPPLRRLVRGGVAHPAHVPAANAAKSIIQTLAILTFRAHIGSMYENQEGDFAYTIRRRTFRSGKTVWRWEVRRSTGDDFVDCGISLRSHDAAETSALDAIFRWNFSQPPSKVHV